ncbi:hypothetical protein [Streptomyces brevispora]|uniref:hypothetical protein n=1 Tax=Streptomyces brevispora TaxID=887462 RepID=UPI003804C023
MSGLTSRLPRWRGRHTAAEPVPVPAVSAPEGPHTVLEEFGAHPDGADPSGAHPDGAAGFLLRSSADRRTSVRELAHSLPVDRERPVVIVDVAPNATANLGEELGGLLARLRDEHRRAARLVLSGAAARKPDGQLPLAQRLADAWDLELEAPDAAAVLVPGGGLYVTEPATPAGGWWRFAPGAEPVALGARIPAPRWQRTLARVPLGELGDHTVRQIPAGLLLHPRGAAAPHPGDLAFALAVNPDRLTVLVSGADTRHDVAEDLATLLARLPAELRDRVRLAPGGGHDLLPVAQRVADLLGTEVEVCTGLPLSVPNPSGGPHTELIRINSPEGECTWPALLTAVRCVPAEPDAPHPAPRPVHWLLPDAVGSPDPEPAVRRMPGGRYVVAVRAGLWVGGSPTPPAAVRERPAEARAVRIEIEDAGTDDQVRGSLLKALAALLPELDGQVREHAEITAPAGTGPETVNALRRFAVRNGLAFTATPAPSAAPGATSAPGTGGPPLEGTARPVSSEHTAVASAPETSVRPAALTSTTSGATANSEASGSAANSATRPPAAAAATRPATSSGPARANAKMTASEPSGPETPKHASAVRAGLSAPVGTPMPHATTAEPAPPAEAATPEPNTKAGEDPAGPRAAKVPPLSPDPAPHTPPDPAPRTPPDPAPHTPPSPVRVPVAVSRRATPAPTGFSSGADRTAFRELAASVWEEHTGPVNQALIRLPALRGPGEEQARVDLVAVHLYLASPPDGRFGALALASEAEPGGGELAPYAACLASGLRRLPALRGTLMRAVPGPAIADEAVPGAFLHCDAPLDVVHLEQKGAPAAPEDHVRYVIRPMTARRTSVLAAPGDSGTTALFAAGTEFCVLARHEASGDRPARVLLAEVPSGAAQFRAPSDEAIARLDEAARRDGGTTATEWPARATGHFPCRT